MTEETKERGELAHLEYKTAEGRVVSSYVELLSVTDSLVTFKTKKNTLVIPISQLIKIKRTGRKYKTMGESKYE